MAASDSGTPPAKPASEMFGAILERIDSAAKIAILSHDRPDGDAIGSTLALGRILRQAGKDVVMLNHDEVPESLRFLPDCERIEPPQEPVAADLVFALDAAGEDRIHESVWRQVPADASRIVIDHHISNAGYGDIDCIDAESPATGQILFQLFEAAGWEIPEAAAIHLYAAISTDTGSFRYPSTTAETMRIGGELIRCGVDVGRVNQMLYETQPRRRVEVLRRLLDGMRFDFDGRCASVALPLAWTRELQLQPGDTEGVVDVLRSIDTVKVAVFFEELEDGKVRVSSRSKEGRYSVGEVCARFGGGGHRLAAGARLPGPLESATDRFLEEVGTLFRRN